MIEIYVSRTSTITGLRGGPLGSDLDDLATAQKLGPIEEQGAPFTADDLLLAFLASL